MIAGICRTTNPHPTDFAHEIRIQRMRILAGSVTSLMQTPCKTWHYRWHNLSCDWFCREYFRSKQETTNLRILMHKARDLSELFPVQFGQQVNQVLRISHVYHSHPELIMGDRVQCLLEVHRAHTGWLLVLACLVHQYSEICDMG